MTTKDDFTAEEWTQLETAPVYAGMGIITADPAITSIFKESAAMAKAMVQICLDAPKTLQTYTCATGTSRGAKDSLDAATCK